MDNGSKINISEELRRIQNTFEDDTKIQNAIDLTLQEMADEQRAPAVRILSNDSQQNVAKLRASLGLPHSFIIPRLDKKGRPVK